MAKRRCKQKTRSGKPCCAWALHGTSRCISHSDKAVQREAGFGGVLNARKGGRATRVPRLTELLRQRVEERADEIIEKLLAGLKAERSLVVGTGPQAHVEVVPDAELVLKTIREIFDRSDGRPTLRTEVKGDFTHTSQSEFDREVADLMKRYEKASANGGSRSSA